MSIFGFVKNLPFYRDKEKPVERLNTRHRFVVEPFVRDIRGARVLDLASHDGRWPYAFAAAGAAEVIGIEGRQELIDQFADYPDDAAKARVTLRQGDINEAVPELVARGERFDVVGVLGIFYHIMTHYALLTQIRALQPKLILIDSEFMNRTDQVIVLIREDPAKELNSLAAFDGQAKVAKGVPSRAAMEMMADTLGYAVEWLDWGSLPVRDRVGVRDYYREGEKTRATCALRPKT